MWAAFLCPQTHSRFFPPDAEEKPVSVRFRCGGVEGLRENFKKNSPRLDSWPHRRHFLDSFWKSPPHLFFYFFFDRFNLDLWSFSTAHWIMSELTSFPAGVKVYFGFVPRASKHTSSSQVGPWKGFLLNLTRLLSPVFEASADSLHWTQICLFHAFTICPWSAPASGATFSASLKDMPQSNPCA